MYLIQAPAGVIIFLDSFFSLFFAFTWKGRKTDSAERNKGGFKTGRKNRLYCPALINGCNLFIRIRELPAF